MTSVDVEFRGADVAGRPVPVITGTVDLPGDARGLSPQEFREAGVPVALFAHCFTCNRKVPAAFRVSKTLARAGIACLRFDFPDLMFSSNVADLQAAAEWLDARLAAPSLLVGHSLGGAAALHAAGSVPSLSAVATIGAPFRPASAARSLQDACAAMRPNEVRTVHLAGRDVAISHDFLADLADASAQDAAAAAAAGVGAPLLVLHSPTDQTVPVSEASRILDAARWPKSMISLQDTDHLLTVRGSAQRAGETIATWAAPHIGRA